MKTLFALSDEYLSEISIINSCTLNEKTISKDWEDQILDEVFSIITVNLNLESTGVVEEDKDFEIIRRFRRRYS